MAEKWRRWSLTARSWIMLGLALLVLGYAGGVLGFAISHPSDGLNVQWMATGFRVAATPAGPLQVGDLIVAIQGRPLETGLLQPGAWYRWGQAQSPPALIYTIEREGQRLEVPVAWRHWPLPWLLSRWAVPLVGLAFVAVAVLLILSRARDPAAPWLIFFFWAEGLNLINNVWTALGANLALSAAWLFFPLDLLTFAVALSMAFHALLLFPERARLLRTHPWLPYSVHALNLLVALVGLVGAGTGSPLLARAWSYRFLYPLSGLELLASLGHLVHVYLRSRQPGVRNQIRWLLWGALLGIWPWLLLQNVPVALGQAPLLPLELLILPLVLVPISFFVAVTRRGLMAVDWLIQRSLLYTALVAALLGFYWAGTVLISALLQWTLGRMAPQLVPLAAIALVALAANPLRLYLQRGIDRLFFRRWVNAEQVLREIGQRLTTTLRLDLLLDLLQEELPARLQLTGALVLQRQADGSWMVPGRTFGPRLAADDPLFRVITPNEVLVLGTGTSPLPEAGSLAEQGWALVLPLYAGGNLVGLYLLGPQLSGDLYRQTEIDALRALAHQIAATLENARLYSEVAQYSASLEVLVAARTRELAITNQTLLVERDRLNTILQNMADGLLVLDPQGVILLVNPALEAIVHRAARRLLGQPVATLELPTLIPLFMQALEMPGQPLSADVTWGEQVLRVSATALRNRAAVIMVLRDVTHEIEVDRMKTEFVSTVSHELRTPLTSVLGFAKLIHRMVEREICPAVPPEAQRAQRALQRIRENLEIIVSEGERLTRLINDVLDIAKMEAGRIEWHDQPVDLARLIQQAVEAVHGVAASKALPVEVVLQPVGAPLIADPDRLLQVLTNLLSNALKFTDHGAVTLTLRPLAGGEVVHGWQTPAPPDRPAGSPGGVLVSIQDTGMGIPAEAMPRLFQRFQQIGDTLRDKPKGTGLGLAICREIITHYGGIIWAESEVGVGSTFSFTLPLVPANVRLQPRPSGPGELVGPWPAEPPTETILIADDDAAIRALLRQTLSEAGYTVLEASDGVQAIAEARRSRPALLILDVRMPGLSGVDVIQVLRSDPRTLRMPVLVLSVEPLPRAWELGIAAQLTKPVEAEVLLQTVARLLHTPAATWQPQVEQEAP